MPNVVYSLVGVQLDASRGDRWSRWRPTVGMCQQPDLLVDRLVLLHADREADLAQTLLEDIALVSPETDVQLERMNFADPWDLEEVYSKLHDFLATQTFAPDREDYLANLTTGTHVAQISWYLLTEARYLPGRLLQLSPPRHRDRDPAGRFQIIDLDLSRYDAIARRHSEEHDTGTAFLKSGIVTRNPAFNRMIEEIERVVIRSDAPVLLLGPTGAGKSQLARRIHALRQMRHQIDGELVEVNCATLRGDNAMSALFGHKRGSFTGAVADRAGLLRAADQGVLFLDEVGELGLDEQAMLLRAIEDGRFLPVGADREVASDFQLIAGTNRDLRADARSGRFREDLLARIDLWTFRLPALTERPEDIEPNIEYELDRTSREQAAKITFSREAMRRYLHFATSPEALWSANFRDLSASITRMTTLAEGGRIDEQVVAREIERLRQDWGGAAPPTKTPLIDTLLDGQELDLFDQRQLEAVLEVCRTSPTLSAAGRRLFQVSRERKRTSNDADRLGKYLSRFGLTWKAVR